MGAMSWFRGVVLILVLGLAACGGNEGAPGEPAPTTTKPPVESSITTTTEVAPPEQATLPSGAGISYPSGWTSYGTGFSGSLELAIPGVANVSVRDAAASEYLYGPQLPNSDSLEEAFSMFEAGMGDATIGETSLTTIDGRIVCMSGE